ncbi:sigma-70 family RNA polymerase sigma factor [Candidatus Poribacteria bacterium]|nr:sigma-70 family RNA polymerase sigma factor [Candidatus Poribacteria bacterium]
MATDNELINRFLAGDRAAFDELVVAHERGVFSVAYRTVGNAETAEEIAQETFVRAFKGLAGFRHKASFSTWLYRITMNLCYNELKHRHQTVELDPETANEADDSPHPGERMAEQERRAWLERQIQTLPFKQRSVLTLRIFQSMPFKEIARVVGCSAISAKVNYRHAMLKLKATAAQSGEVL